MISHKFGSASPTVVDMEKPESVQKDGKKSSPLKEALYYSLQQMVSASCGLLMPFCQTHWQWATVLSVSILNYLPIFTRVQKKKALFEEQPKGSSADENEVFDRKYFAYSLIKLCSIIWTVLVVFWTVNSALHVALPSTHVLVVPTLSMVFDTFFDVMAKGLYLKTIVDVHSAVFDSDARTERQFRDLQKLMKTLWLSTTDVIIISVKGRDRTSSVLSPSFHKLLALLQTSSSELSPSRTESHETTEQGLLLHTASSGEEPRVYDANRIDSHHISPEDDSVEDNITGLKTLGKVPISSQEVETGAGLIHTCWKRLCDESCSDDGKNSGAMIQEYVNEITKEKFTFEIKLSQRADSFVGIVRNVTERVKLHDAEKRAQATVIARQRDAQSVNRFTRHEIKNGLLAGMELCDRLNQSFQTASKSIDDSVPVLVHKDEYLSIDSQMTKTGAMIGQVDQVLGEVLDTVLAEAMARDVIYEVYNSTPKKQDLISLLRSTGCGVGVEPRFPLVVRPSGMDLPKLLLDAQMLKYIHRNAVSNAMKYGRLGGVVSTNVFYQLEKKHLTIEVVNEPGPGHDRLMQMGEEATSAVFRQKTRLHDDTGDQDDHKHLSDGDGAWIMQKCAKNMGGHCEITFEQNQTRFIFSCPAEPIIEPLRTSGAPEHPKFELPSNTYAIGIDDSWIQRKLMLRIFNTAGISAGRTKVLGRDTTELDSISRLIAAIMTQEPDSKILILVDENLDYVDDAGGRLIRSGSKIMERCLKSMPSARRNRVLCLVRSANDSASDVAAYAERTHGFFSKTVTKKDGIMEILEPAWRARFGDMPRPEDDALKNILNCFGEDSPTESVCREDLKEVVSSVDELLRGRKSFRDIPWSHLWSALHSLKGDIMISENKWFIQAAEDISAMRGSQAPSDFDERWAQIRQSVMEGIDQDDALE